MLLKTLSKGGLALRPPAAVKYGTHTAHNTHDAVVVFCSCDYATLHTFLEFAIVAAWCLSLFFVGRDPGAIWCVWCGVVLLLAAAAAGKKNAKKFVLFFWLVADSGQINDETVDIIARAKFLIPALRHHVCCWSWRTNNIPEYHKVWVIGVLPIPVASGHGNTLIVIIRATTMSIDFNNCCGLAVNCISDVSAAGRSRLQNADV